MTGEQLEAVFRVHGSHILANVAAFGTGFSSAFGVNATEATGLVTNLPGARSRSSQFVLVRATEEGIALRASDRNGSEGPLLLEAQQGTFRAALHRNIGQFQLFLFIPDQLPIELSG